CKITYGRGGVHTGRFRPEMKAPPGFPRTAPEITRPLRLLGVRFGEAHRTVAATRTVVQHEDEVDHRHRERNVRVDLQGLAVAGFAGFHDHLLLGGTFRRGARGFQLRPLDRVHFGEPEEARGSFRTDFFVHGRVAGL